MPGRSARTSSTAAWRSRRRAARIGSRSRVRYRGGACWIFPSPEAAADCNANGSQCLTGYPHADAGTCANNYYGRVWDDVHHAMFHGLNDAAPSRGGRALGRQ